MQSFVNIIFDGLICKSGLESAIRANPLAGSHPGGKNALYAVCVMPRREILIHSRVMSSHHSLEKQLSLTHSALSSSAIEALLHRHPLIRKNFCLSPLISYIDFLRIKEHAALSHQTKDLHSVAAFFSLLIIKSGGR